MDRNELFTLITTRFNLEGIQGLCFSLGIDDENVPGATKDAKARALIQYCERNDLIDQLAELVQEKSEIVFKGAAGSPTRTRNSVIAVFIIAGLFAISNPLINALMPNPTHTAGIAPVISTPTNIVNTTIAQSPSATAANAPTPLINVDTSQVSSDQNISPDYRWVHTLTVPANERWFATGITPTLGQPISISAAGSVFLFKGDLATEHEPNGHRKIDDDFVPVICDSSKCAAEGQYFGELIGRLGTGIPFAIGSGTVFTPTTEAELQLIVNDSNYGDNDGAYLVTIKSPK